MNISIRQKMIVAIVVPLVLISGLALAFQFYELRKASLRQLQSYASQLAFHYAARIDSELEKVAQVARSSAAILSVHPHLSEEEVYRFLTANVQQNPLVYGSCMAFEPRAFHPQQDLFAPYVFRGDKGLQRLEVGKDAYNYRTWDWYKLPIARNTGLWTEPFFDKGAGNVTMSTYAVPFYKDDRIWGVVTVDLRLEDLQKTCGVTEIQGTHFAVISHNGTIISHPNPAFIMKETVFTLAAHNNRPDMAALGTRMIAGESGVVRLPGLLTTEPHWFFYAPIPSVGWSFVAVVPEAQVMAPVYALVRTGVLSVLTALVCMVLTILVVTFRITRPLKNLTFAATAIAAGNLDGPDVLTSSTDEIGHLTRVFNKMVRDLKAHILSLTKETIAREAVESEVRLARNVQVSLLPHTFPPFPERHEFALHAMNAPAKFVAGDFFDYFFTEPNVLTLVIADVSGKGVAAAMFMAVVRTLIRDLAKRNDSPARILSEANQTLVDDGAHARFVTIFVGRYNIQTGELLYASAGHLPPYTVRGESKPIYAGEATGTILGMIPGAVYEERRLTLDIDDRFLLYTDGITEARAPTGGFFGNERLEASFHALRSQEPSGICDGLVRAVLDFQNQLPHDDITVMVLHRKKSGATLKVGA